MRSPAVQRERYTCQGGSVSQPTPVTNAYDPQIGAAALKSADTAAAAQDWTQNYYSQYVTPAMQKLIDAQTSASAKQNDISDAEMAALKKSGDQQDQIFNADFAAQKQQQDTYNQYGLPAVKSFYDQSAAFSTPQYQEQQAAGALGDQRTAFQGQQGALQRSMAQAGIDPSSPAAMAAMSDSRMQEAAQEAAASTRARSAAQQMGLQVAGNAASFAQGQPQLALNAGAGASGASTGGSNATTNTGSAASGAANSALGAASTGLSGTISGASVPMAGYNAAQAGYGNVLNAWSGLGNSSISSNTALQKAYMDAQAQQNTGMAAGIGGFLGSAAAFIPKIAGSDRRLKTNIVRVGEITVRGQQLPVYDFEYIYRPGVVRGVMADEVEPIIPEAVVTSALGLKLVDYAQLEAA